MIFHLQNSCSLLQFKLKILDVLSTTKFQNDAKEKKNQPSSRISIPFDLNARIIALTLCDSSKAEIQVNVSIQAR